MSILSFSRQHLAKLLQNTSLLILFVISLQPVTTFAADKIAVKPVEPFFQQVSADAPKVYLPNVTYLSPLKQAPISFSSLGATWKQSLPQQTNLQLEIRLQSAEKLSDWYVLAPEIDTKDDQNSTQQSTSNPDQLVEASAFLTANQSDSYQYRITLNSKDSSKTPILDNLKFTFIDGGSPQQKTDLLLNSTQTETNSSADLESNEFMPADLSLLDKSVLPQATQNTKRSESSTSLQACLDCNQSLQAEAESPTILPANLRTSMPVRVNRIATPNTTNTINSKLNIISRATWGADESIRLFNPSAQQSEPKLVKFEDDYYTKYASELKETKRITTDANGNLLTWPLTYPETIKKIVIHHTATAKDLDDPQKAIRDIYTWHTLSKGWGDIGYNYIIDQQGNIYEGRYGGEMVVGAHAGRGNHGSIGIAVLGNYSETEPSEAVITSLTALIKEKAQIYHIDTEGADLFRGESYPNVMGHRDIMSTSCPGDRLYEMLPIIRKLAKVNNFTTTTSNFSSDYDFAFTKTTPVISFAPKARKTITFDLKNTGKQTWGADTYFQIKQDNSSSTFLRSADQILSSKVGRDIAPGQSVQVQMLTFANITSGSSLIQIFPVINGNQKVERYLSFGLQVQTPAPQIKYDYELVSIIYGKTSFNKGDLVNVQIRLRNKGLVPWNKAGENKVDLGSDKPRDHKNVLLEKPGTRLANMQEDLVKNGEVGTFSFNITIPSQDGIYREYFSPVVEGVQWMNNRDSYIQVKVGNSDKYMNIDNTDSEGEYSSAPGFLKPASQGAGVPESVAKFTRNSSTTSITPIATTPASTISSNPTPIGSSTVNIATTALDLNSTPRPIRIDLSYRGNPATISADGPFALYQGPTKISDFVANQKVNVNYQDSAFQISSIQPNQPSQKWTISARPRFVPAGGSIMRIDTWNRPNDWGDHANNNEFRGVLEAIIYENELHFVNELSLEDYLKGLAEESASQPVEKIKAIMIVARTYGRFYMEVSKKFPGAPFDLNDDPNYSQKYTGYSFEKRSPVTANLATATAGKYVTYQGKLIKTPFFSKSDGKRTISAKDKWGWTDTPFLNSVDDSLCQSTAFSGHGVGLSGCGATAMANLGKTYEEIIKYYYQGTAVSQGSY